MPVTKQLHIIAGPNGAGKTTFAKSLLPASLDTTEFVNADEIAKGLSPFNPSSVNLLAAKTMVKRIEDLVKRNESLAIETTLAGANYVKLIKKVKEKGYLVNLIFLYLDNPELAKIRVECRVKAGGHNIIEADIIRRYYRGLANLVDLYLPIADNALIIDDSNHKKEIIIKKSKRKFTIFQSDMWEKILKIKIIK
jgi:predicted ABC-type ATPase